MKRTLQKAIHRWQEAGLVDEDAIQRITKFENGFERNHDLRWPAVLLWTFGCLMLTAGVLLFVAAHWDTLSPTARFIVVLTALASIHVMAALLNRRQPLLGSILHAAGTLALGGAIFLAAQIFHLEEHWQSGFMLWALGAWLTWALLSDWIQLVLAAVLTPVWLVGEWVSAVEPAIGAGATIAAQGVLLLAITYFSALGVGRTSYFRCALAWLGGLALIPSAIVLAADTDGVFRTGEGISVGLAVSGWMVAFGGPLFIAYLLRKEHAWPNLIAAGWVSLLAWAGSWPISQYAFCALFSLFLVWWGFKEGRRERISMGIAGFGLTLLFFYFSSVMDKLGRSLSLVGLGILFLLLAWALLKFRRRLFHRLEEGAS